MYDGANGNFDRLARACQLTAETANSGDGCIRVLVAFVSRAGGSPNMRPYSRVNWMTLSYQLRRARLARGRCVPGATAR
jgi:hypothetical protein